MRSNEVILLVEDDPNEVALIRRAFKEGGITNPLQVVETGEDAIAYVAGEGKYRNRDEHPLPILVLLDLTLPGVDGFHVIAWIRKQEGIRRLPVIVLTGSEVIRNVNQAYAAGANSFFIKDIDLLKTTEFCNLLRTYWLERAMTPEIHREPRKPENK